MPFCTMMKGTLKIARGLSTEQYNKVSLLFATTLDTGNPPKDGDGSRYKQGDRYGWHCADNHRDKSEMWLWTWIILPLLLVVVVPWIRMNVNNEYLEKLYRQ